jgi:hypothetical protein
MLHTARYELIWTIVTKWVFFVLKLVVPYFDEIFRVVSSLKIATRVYLILVVAWAPAVRSARGSCFVTAAAFSGAMHYEDRQ